MRVSFVVCPSFHGATLLALLLNNHSSVSALGDTNPSREYDQTCACGKKVSECSFWKVIVERLRLERFVDRANYLPTLPWPLIDRHLEGSRFALTHSPGVNRALGMTAARSADAILPLLWHRRSPIPRGYAETWKQFYELVGQLHATSMVVDGTKSSRKVKLMSSWLEDDADVRVLHVVRDPRAFAASMVRQGLSSDLREIGWLWRDLHERTQALSKTMPYLRIRYEDLARTPEAVMGSVFAFFRLTPEPVVMPPRFPNKHHLMGNAMIFSFDGRVELDERWRTALGDRDQETVIRHARSLAARYGYT